MDQDAVLVVCCFFDEIQNLNRNLIIVIKEELAIIVKPVESQVLNTNGGPLVLKLASSTIDDVRDLVDGKEL